MGEIIKNPITIIIYMFVMPLLVLIVFAAWTSRNEQVNSAASVEYVDSENIKQDVICKDTKDDLQRQIDNKPDKEDFNLLLEEIRINRKYIMGHDK